LRRVTRSRACLLASLAAFLVLAAVTGCGSHATLPALKSTASTLPPVPTASSTASGSAQAQARQAYLSMWQAFVTASKTADYQSPALASYATGAALTLLVHGLYQNYQNGIVTRGQPAFDPQVTVTVSGGSPAQANVTDCASSATWANYYRSGKPAPGASPGRQRVYAQLQPYFGAWKVTSLVVEKAGTC
jgi:hypothetical protein